MLTEHKHVMNYEERFFAKVKKTPTCWYWTAGIRGGNNGYGHANYYGKAMGAHCASYLIHNGENSIPKGMLVRHTCDNRRCVNPDHLVLGTYQDNAEDRMLRNRSNAARGKNHWTKRHPEWMRYGYKHRGKYTKLNPTVVSQIKNLLASRRYTVASIADHLKLARSTVNHIRRGIVWKSVLPANGTFQLHEISLDGCLIVCKPHEFLDYSI